MENKKVSIIIPCYNIEKYLDNCFKSLDNLTYQNLEIIFINDGSPDNSLSKIQNYCNLNKKAKVISKQNGGLSSARNTGIDNATGDYIYFYDPDDILHPSVIEVVIKVLQNQDLQMAVFGFQKSKDGKSYEQYKFKKGKNTKLKFYNQEECLQQYLSQKEFDFCVWNKIYQRDIIVKNNIRFDDCCRYGEDTKFNYLYMKNINRCVLIQKQLYYYIQRKNSLVHQKFNENRLTAFYSLNYMVNDANKDKNIYPYVQAIRTLVCCEMLYFIKKSDYCNVNAINKLLMYVKEGVPYLKSCKKIAIHRRKLIPLVPSVAKLLLKKRIKNGDKNSALPLSMQ